MAIGSLEAASLAVPIDTVVADSLDDVAELACLGHEGSYAVGLFNSETLQPREIEMDASEAAEDDVGLRKIGLIYKTIGERSVGLTWRRSDGDAIVLERC